MQVTLFSLFQGRVDDEFIADLAHQNGTGRTFEGDVGYAQGDRGTDHGHDFGGAVKVCAHDGCHHVHVVVIALREQRADRTVHQTGAQGRLFGRFSFSLDEAAGDLSGRIHFFFIVAGQREEVDAFLRFCGCGSRYEDDGVAVADHGGAVAQLRDFTGFDPKGSSGEFQFKYVEIVHFLPPFFI